MRAFHPGKGNNLRKDRGRETAQVSLGSLCGSSSSKGKRDGRDEAGARGQRVCLPHTFVCC